MTRRTSPSILSGLSPCGPYSSCDTSLAALSSIVMEGCRATRLMTVKGFPVLLRDLVKIWVVTEKERPHSYTQKEITPKATMSLNLMIPWNEAIVRSHESKRVGRCLPPALRRGCGEPLAESRTKLATPLECVGENRRLNFFRHKFRTTSRISTSFTWLR